MKKAFIWIKNVGIALTVVLALISIWDWTHRSTLKLTATVEYSAFAYPPDLINMLRFQVVKYPTRNAKPDVKPEVIFDSKESTTKEIESQEDVDQVVEKNINKPVGFVFQSTTYSQVRSLYHVRVRNGGDKKLDSIVMKLPEILHYVITRESGQEIKGKTSFERSTPQGIPLIELGELSPDEELTFYAWSRYPPSGYLLRDILIRHSEGKGEINFQKQEVPDVISQYSIEILLKLIVAMAIVLGAVLIYTHFRDTHISPNKSKEDS